MSRLMWMIVITIVLAAIAYVAKWLFIALVVVGGGLWLWNAVLAKRSPATQDPHKSGSQRPYGRESYSDEIPPALKPPSVDSKTACVKSRTANACCASSISLRAVNTPVCHSK